ncbi:MAG: hypothetical protein M0R50_06040 [Candidatus Cloacimonetes bacterium]|jgi:hypothetical protein|nr:hypothetical protein [Candidatus Cloacimonadota bacterium]
MVFLEITEWFIAAAIILVFATQIFTPLWKGEKLFPVFRTKLIVLDEEVAAVKEEVSVATTKRKIKKLKQTVKDLEKDNEE